jgi:hypothetical protein
MNQFFRKFEQDSLLKICLFLIGENKGLYGGILNVAAIVACSVALGFFVIRCVLNEAQALFC